MRYACPSHMDLSYYHWVAPTLETTTVALNKSEKTFQLPFEAPIIHSDIQILFSVSGFRFDKQMPNYPLPFTFLGSNSESLRAKSEAFSGTLSAKKASVQPHYKEHMLRANICDIKLQ